MTSRFSFGNIGESLSERTAFWQALEAAERKGGRVQSRIVWELPHEASAQARHEMLRRFCSRLEAMGLPYWAVVHAPTKANDARNFHAHIVYNEAPAKRMLDPAEFLSPHGLRALSRYHHDHPATLDIEGYHYSVDYEPAESTSPLFGGNSNWRGPIWMPVNVLLADALRTYGHYLGDQIRVEVPTGSGTSMTLVDAADEIDRRLIALFRRGLSGRRPSDGNRIEASDNPLWNSQVTFNEYFHGDTGEGLGASHQTGWTALIAHVLCRP